MRITWWVRFWQGFIADAQYWLAALEAAERGLYTQVPPPTIESTESYPRRRKYEP